MTKTYAYAKMQNRNAKAKEMKSQGFAIRKTSIKGQLCDPRYMQDYDPNMGEDYQTYFSTIYILEVD